MGSISILFKLSSKEQKSWRSWDSKPPNKASMLIITMLFERTRSE